MHKHSPNNLPIFPRGSGRRNRCPTQLTSAFSVDPSHTLLCVSGSWQADIGELSTKVTVVALVDNERVFRDRSRVDLVGIKEVDEFRLCRGSRGGRGETNVIGSGSGNSLRFVSFFSLAFAFDVDLKSRLTRWRTE